MSLVHPIIRLKGTARERGLQYGQAAKDKIWHSLQTYKTLFAGHAHMSWEQAVQAARAFEAAFLEYLPQAKEEMQGIAEGAGLRYEDILTLNCRSELMFARPDGCSTIAVLPQSSGNDHTYLAQTWDWIMPSRASTVILDIEQAPLPRILMVAEAGMIGGKGLNECGIGVALNALSVGHGQIGVPLHAMYRGILNSTLITDAMDRVTQCKRAGAGNFMIASAQGLAFSVEYTPEDFDVLSTLGEPLCHTNHYLSPLLRAEDTLKAAVTDTFVRLNRLQIRSQEKVGQLNVGTIMEIFSDHANCPDSLCSHEDPKDPQAARFCTVYAVAMDLTDRTLWVTNGYPCEGPAYPVTFK